MANLKLDFVRDDSLPNPGDYVIIVLENGETRVARYSFGVFYVLWCPLTIDSFKKFDLNETTKVGWKPHEIKAWAAIPTTINLDAIERAE